MKWRVAVITCVGIVSIAALVWTLAGRVAAQNGNKISAPIPDHLWNRLNETLFARTAPNGKIYGLNELDILYWYRTKHLLVGPSHKQALAILDEFINKHGERLINDPLKRALLQRDLWALFDWVAAPTPYGRAQFPKARRELESRLAVVIRRLELTTNEIASLPNNYALAEKHHLPDLPMGLFSANSVWIKVSADNVEQIVPTHTKSFGGRSVFSVWFHDADGRQAGLRYLKRLDTVKPMFTYAVNRNSQAGFELNPNLSQFSTNSQLNPNFPEFPTNSQWVLARCMCVIDANSRIQPTHVVESIQLRRYWGLGPPYYVTIRNQNGRAVSEQVPQQRFNEFRMTRDAQANLASLAQDHRDFVFVHLDSAGIDAFESYPSDEIFNIKRVQSRVLGTCVQCHNRPGIYSVNCFTRFISFSFPPDDETTHLIESDPQRENEVTVDWKQRQYTWKLLEGLLDQEH